MEVSQLVQVSLPLTPWVTDEVRSKWLRRAIWLVLPFEVLLGALLVGAYSKAPVTEVLTLVALKTCGILVVALALRWVFSLCNVTFVSNRQDESGKFPDLNSAEFVLWSMSLWLISNAVWIVIELFYKFMFLTVFEPKEDLVNFLYSHLGFDGSFRPYSEPYLFLGWYLPVLMYLIITLLIIAIANPLIFGRSSIKIGLRTVFAQLIIAAAIAMPIAYADTIAYEIVVQ